MALARYQYYNTNDDNAGQLYGATWLGQTFTPATSHLLLYAKLKIYKVGNPGTVTVSIRATSGSVPTGADLASGTTDGDTLTTSSPGEWRTITLLPGVSLTAGTMYAICIRATGGDASNYIWFRADVSSPSYTGGTQVNSANSGSTWGSTATTDAMFEEWGSGATSAIDEKTYSRRLVAIGAFSLWYESAAGTMSELSDATLDIDTATPLSAASAYQKLFIANGTTQKVFDYVNTKINTADAGVNPCTQGMTLTGGNSAAEMIVDYADGVTDDAAANVYGKRITTATFTNGETVTGTNGSGDAVSFATSAAETAPPHWYDWTVFGNDTTTYGIKPSSATIVTRYRGRLILSGYSTYPHQWYMCKTGDPWNFLYGTNDPLTAVAGQDAMAGEIGDVVIALIAYNDDYMIVGCANSMHLITGDPAYGGSIDEISDNIGIVGANAWCKDNDGNLYFFGTGGIYKMEGGRSRPLNISVGALPKLINDWAYDPTDERILLTFDPVRNGIIISKSSGTDGSNVNYWFSLRTSGFYPEVYPDECGIFSSIYYDSTTSANRDTLYGCNDGYIRYFLNTAKDDDVGVTDDAISSYMTLPAFPMGDGFDVEGKILQIVFESGGGGSGGDFSDTDGFSYGVYVSDDAETVVEKVKATTAWADATNYVIGDLVTYGGLEYICIVAHLSATGAATHEEPDTNTTDWNPATSLTGTISGTGRKSRIRQKIRGQYSTIKLYNSTASETFVVNKVLAEKQIVGRLKD